MSHTLHTSEFHMTPKTTDSGELTARNLIVFREVGTTASSSSKALAFLPGDGTSGLAIQRGHTGGIAEEDSMLTCLGSSRIRSKQPLIPLGVCPCEGKWPPNQSSGDYRDTSRTASPRNQVQPSSESADVRIHEAQPQDNRAAQLADIAASTDEDAAECAAADLFREFTDPRG